MRKSVYLLFALAAGIALSCGQRGTAGGQLSADSSLISRPGDSAIYGLACDGSSDTLLVLLRDVDADPDTFNMLEAVMNRQVFGRPAAGDLLAVLLSGDSAHSVQKIINVERLKGSWCYMVTPTLRRRAGMSDEKYRQLLDQMPDSLRRRWMVPKEFGFQLRANNVCLPVGERIEEEKNSPIVYEKPRRYREWRLQNCQLLLSEHLRDTTAGQWKLLTDTAEFVRLSRDTLVLRFGDGERTYYKKP